VKIKVLHIIKSLGRGGAEMLLPETLKLHSTDRFEFQYLYFLPWKNQMVESLESNGGLVMCYPANNNLRILFKAREIAAYVKANNIQMIHAHLPWAGIVARIVGRLTNIPVVYTEHNKQERYHFATRWMNLATMNWQRCVIAVSSDVNESIRKHKSSLKAELITILNGVNTNHFDVGKFNGSEVRQALAIPPGAPVIGTIAVFRFQKRLDVWLEIAKTILKDSPDAHFVIVGDGPLKNDLLLKTRELGLEDKVHFAGLQTEVRPYLAAFDLYMMSSIFEGLPIALLEAMASGCTVISTDAGGVKEVIRHEVDGLMCDVNQPERLASLAVNLLKDESSRKALGIQARKRIIESFSMEKMVAQLEEHYSNVVHSR
jgi:glycosyltransferase involved in cell wall biosynthesis